MLYAYTEHLFGTKSLYRCHTQLALDWLINWKRSRGYNCRQCTEAEAFAITCEIGEGCWCFDIGKNKAGEYVRMPYQYWREND